MDAMIPNKMFVFFFQTSFSRVFHGISGCPDICHLVIHVPKIERIDKTWMTWIHIVSHSVYLY